ncbi:hypothetical protein RYX36_029751 [Vicia faba]
MKVLGSSDEGSKDEVVSNQPDKEYTQSGVAYPDKGKVVESGDEGSKHEVEAKETAKEDTECAAGEPDKSPVIKKCFTEPQSSIIIYDSDMRKAYPCKLKTRKDLDKIETFICKGLYEFAEAQRLVKGVILNFTIGYPPASCLSVSVDKN